MKEMRATEGEEEKCPDRRKLSCFRFNSHAPTRSNGSRFAERRL